MDKKKPNAKKTAAKKTAAVKVAKKRGRPAQSAEVKAAKVAAKNQAKGEERQEAAKAASGAAEADPKKRELFLHHLPKIDRLKKRVASVSGELRNALKEADKDGFVKHQFETAILLQTPEGEAKVRQELSEKLEAANYVGSVLGNQLDLFGAPDRTPLVDRAKDEGRMASMKNSAAMPPYSPDTEAYRAYMNGFHEHQAELAAKGFQQKTEQGAAGGKTAKVPPAPQPAPGAGVTSGVAITRAQMKAQQEQQRAAAAAASEGDGNGEDDGDDGSFERMAVAGAA